MGWEIIRSNIRQDAVPYGHFDGIRKWGIEALLGWSGTSVATISHPYLQLRRSDI